MCSYTTLKNVWPSRIKNGTSCGLTSSTTCVPFARPVTGAEARVEEPGIVGAQFTEGRFIGHHFGRVPRGHFDALMRSQDIKLFGLEQQRIVGLPVDGFPEVERRIMADFRQIDHVTVLFRPIPHDLAARAGTPQVDPQKEAVIHPDILSREGRASATSSSL